MIINEILLGDCIEQLATLPEKSAQCCVTSPPYFGLRDYGNDGQIGLEETPEAYVHKLVEVFQQVKRVLADDGTLWLNLGDSYATTGGHTGVGPNAQVGNTKAGIQHGRIRASLDGLKSKDLIGIPWRVAFALQADGWYLRQDIIWHKPNPMPESVTDRCTKAHEYLFLLTKEPSYFYNNEAIKDDAKESSIQRVKKSWKTDRLNVGKDGADSVDVSAMGDRWCNGKANKRSVWTVTTKPFKEAHFATYPEELIQPCILAGTRENDIVLDPFMGAGTTALVALKAGRNFIGTEINPQYRDIALKRIEPLLSQSRLF